MPSPYITLAESWKEFPGAFSWGEPHPTDKEWSVLVPLDVADVTIGGFGLRIKCNKDRWEQDVMFQLEVGRPGQRTRTALARIEWRPLQDVHRDPKVGSVKRKVIRGTHYHPFRANFLETTGIMREGNLPYAIEVERDPQSFLELLDLASKLFRINGLKDMLPPPWQGKIV